MNKLYATLLITGMFVFSLALMDHKSTADAAQQLTARISSAAAASTPTDTEPPPATDNTTTDGCIKVTPAEITVSGEGPVTADVTISLIRDDVITLPKAELEKLEVLIDDSCADYISINKVTAGGTADKPQVTANITVQGSAAGTACSIQVTDPQGIADPPLNCEGSISFTGAAEPGDDCALESISPASVTVGLTFVPRLVKVTIKGNENALFSKGSALSFDGSGITPLYVIAKDAQTLYATVLVWGAEKGQYTASVDGCSGVAFEVK